MKADIIEEITRIYGYDNFDIHTADAPLYPVRPDMEKSVEDKVKDILVKRYSLHELHSYIWAYHDEYKALGIEIENNVKLANSANPNIETLRRSIVPTQLCQVKYNAAYLADFGVFEVGRTVNGLGADGLCDEHKKLSITLFSKTKDTEALYRELYTMLCVVADDIKHEKIIANAKTAKSSYQHTKNLNALVCAGVEIGEIGVVHPVVAKNIDKKAAIVYAEIDIALFSGIANKSIQYREPSRFPEMEIDLSFVSDKFAPIEKAIADQNCALIKNVSVTDIYKDENGKSITTRIVFSHPERTLTREEVTEITDKIIADLANAGIALKQ